jgi:hypothetical protein
VFASRSFDFTGTGFPVSRPFLRPGLTMTTHPPDRSRGPAATALRLVAAALVAIVLFPLGALAQAAPSGGGSGTPAPPSHTFIPEDPVEAVHHLLARRALTDAHRMHGTLGLLTAAGGPIPASPSTAGQRMQGAPRWVLDAGVGVVRGNLPAGDGEDRWDEGPRSVLLAPRVTVAGGVFEGLSPAPTVGGIGSLDLVAEARWVGVPSPSNLDGGAFAWGVGARVGVLRESFTLPGITLVAMHRRMGQVERQSGVEDWTLAGLPEGSAGPYEGSHRVSTSPAITSVRGVVGKDMMEVGLSAGVQRDWIRGYAEVETRVDGTGAQGREVQTQSLRMPLDRTTWFVGVNRTWVVTQVSLELGWSPDPGAGTNHVGDTRLTGGSGAGSAFSGALSFRITY